MSGISIIIVNYNVKYFLRQCLQSIYASECTVPYEVFVVDNASHDGSQLMAETYFPEVKWIQNEENLGFSKANNLAIALCNYNHTLILNPDTIIQEDTLQVVYDFMLTHPDAGAVGVKMVDGSGCYLPESKRGFPSPLSAIFKLTGISKLLPKSKFFNAYYAGHLSVAKENKVDVLTGAFMFFRTALLQEIGGFDEDYFMYGEDIELSYAVKEKGYENYYLPSTQIIHFKGESTKKISRTYIKNFYGAMAIYANKRSDKGSVMWRLVLYIGIILSAILGTTKKLISRVLRPMFDIMILLVLTMGLQLAWAKCYHHDAAYYSNANFSVVYLGVILTAIFCYYLFGQYDDRHNLKHLIYGFFLSTALSLSIYSLLPTAFRFSRFILLILCLCSPIILYLTRLVYNYFLKGRFSFDTNRNKRIGIVGQGSSVAKISELVRHFSSSSELVGHVGIGTETGDLGRLDDLASIVDSRALNELIFCSADLPLNKIFGSMATLGTKVSYKVANNDNTSILGSDSKERVGEWYTIDIGFKVNQPFHVRTKRILDIGFALCLILVFPVMLVSPNRFPFLLNLWSVIIGKKSWTGYTVGDPKHHELPRIRPGVFSSEDSRGFVDNHSFNLWYSKNYSTWTEFVALIKLLYTKRAANTYD